MAQVPLSKCATDVQDEEQGAQCPAPGSSGPGAADPPVWRQVLQAWNVGENLRGVGRRPAGALGALDGLRALAVCWVVVYHCMVTWMGLGSSGPGNYNEVHKLWIVQPALSGDLGVDIFFVLSGFLIALQAVRELQRAGKVNFWAFLFARWWRISPTYYLAIGLVVAVDLYGLRAECGWSSVWGNLLFVNNMQQHGLGVPGQICMTWTWSIGMEMQFYLLTPWIIRAACRPDGAPRQFCFTGLLVAFALVVVVRALMLAYVHNGPGAPPQMTNVLWTRAHVYLAGIAACLAYTQAAPLTQEVGLWVRFARRGGDLVCTALIVGIAFAGNGMNLSRPVALLAPRWVNSLLMVTSQGLFGVAVAWWAYRSCTAQASTVSRVLGAPLWVPLARLSYSAYLLQFLAVAPIQQHWKVFRSGASLSLTVLEWMLFTMVTLFAVFTVALVFHLLVEAPSLRLRQLVTPKIWRR